MKSLKGKARVKVLAFLLAMLSLFMLMINCCYALFLFTNNMFYADRQSFGNKIYSYFAESSINDIIGYYNVYNSCNASFYDDDENKDYWQSELELYKSKYSKDNSNVYFTVTDENGDPVLYNDTLTGNAAYSFSRTFSTETVTDADGKIRYYSYNTDEDTYNAVEIETTTVDEALTEAATEATPAETTADTTTYIDTDSDADDSNISVTSYSSATIIWAKNRSLDGRYLFNSADGFDSSIYAYCCEEFASERENGNTNALVYIQSNYFVDENGDIVQSAAYTEDGVYTTKTTKYTVNLYIPTEENMTASDIYMFAAKMINLIFAYKKALIATSIIFALLFVAFSLILLICSGYVKDSDTPVARGIHYVPSDIAAIVFGVLTFFAIYIENDLCAFINISDMEIFFIGTVAYAEAMLVLIFTESIVVRVKSKTLFKNTVIYRILKYLNKIAENTNLTIKIVLACLTEIILIFCGCMLFNYIEDVFVNTIIAAVIVLPVTVILMYEAGIVNGGAKKMSEGDLDVPIKEKLLFGPFKRHAQYLNGINKSVNTAVNERMKSESMKTELITNVSHDLKTPLTSIVNYIDLLKKQNIDDPTALEYIDVIDRQSQRLKKLTVDIVDASKAATGNVEVNSEKLDMRVMVSQTEGEFLEKLQEKNLSLIIDTPDTPAYIYVDGRLLWRVFDNIIGNACKYSMPGTRVYLSVKNENGVVSATLRNISKEKLNINPEELTERFVRGDSSRNTEGSGLGLSIAKSLTGLMNGTMNIDIDGDLFKVTVSFPLAE